MVVSGAGSVYKGEDSSSTGRATSNKCTSAQRDGSMKKTFILIYLAGFAVLFLICAVIWHWQMAGSYFVCQQNGVIMDFIPPFIHPGMSGNIYLKPQRVVYAIWSIYAGATVLLPGVAAWLMIRLHDRELKNSWR